MRARPALILALSAMLLCGALLQEAFCASIRMRVVVLNPSEKLTQSKSVRAALPREVTAQDIIDDGGLEIEYDNSQGIFVAQKKDIELTPGESKVFEVIINDIWMISEDKIEFMRKRTENIVRVMRDTKAYERVALIAEGMYARMDQIIRTQNNPSVSTNQHIAYYRDNVKIMEQLEKDIAELERLLVTSGGAVSIDAVEDADVDVKGPDAKTTWILIFVILVFIGILGAVFYFTWQGQGGPKKKDETAPSAFKENNPG
jgi:hypothetical protein